jgi:hypothetical protein
MRDGPAAISDTVSSLGGRGRQGGTCGRAVAGSAGTWGIQPIVLFLSPDIPVENRRSCESISLEGGATPAGTLPSLRFIPRFGSRRTFCGSSGRASLQSIDWTVCSGSRKDAGSQRARVGSISVNGSSCSGRMGLTDAGGLSNSFRIASNEAAISMASPAGIGISPPHAAKALLIATVWSGLLMSLFIGGPETCGLLRTASYAALL